MRVVKYGHSFRVGWNIGSRFSSERFMGKGGRWGVVSGLGDEEGQLPLLF